MAQGSVVGVLLTITRTLCEPGLMPEKLALIVPFPVVTVPELASSPGSKMPLSFSSIQMANEKGIAFAVIEKTSPGCPWT